MKYGSVCSGVEAATVAWPGLGWEPPWVSEIEKFPSEVLQHHYPDVPNLGDMTKFKEWPSDRSIDLLVGGTPCQSFSVAGLRKGLDDPRGNLMLTYLAIAAQYQPQWLVWENVPGVLSSNRGRDFGTFLGALGKLGYGFAYRVLDAQYFGVAQRRRRVFVVGYLGDWRRAAAVLFERESMSRNPPPRPSKGQDPASPAQVGPGSDGFGRGRVIDTVTAKWSKGADVQLGSQTGGNLHVERVTETVTAKWEKGADVQLGWVSNYGNLHVEQTYVGGDVAHTLHKSYHVLEVDQDAKNGVFVVEGEAHTWSAPAIGYLKDDDLAGTITANSGEPGETQTPALVGQSVFVHHSQDSRMIEAEEVAGTLNTNDSGRFGHAVVEPIPIQDASDSQKEQNGVGVGQEGDASFTLFARNTHGVAQPIGFNCMQDTTEHIEMVPTISTGNQQGISNNAVVHCADVAPAMTASGPPYDRTGNSRVESDALAVQQQSGLIVRRLTPLECERLQGFPDGYTMIPWKGKPPENCPDGPRYRALGNSMAVPVMRWIGEGIDMVHRIPVADQAKSGVQEWL